MFVTNPPVVSTVQSYLLAAARSVDANTLATTTLAWQGTATAANSFPVAVRIYRRTGTLSLLIGTVLLNSVVIQTVSAIQSALLGAAADPLHYPVSSTTSVTIVPISGNYQFTVGTINGSGATIDVEIWGLRTS